MTKAVSVALALAMAVAGCAKDSKDSAPAAGDTVGDTAGGGGAASDSTSGRSARIAPPPPARIGNGPSLAPAGDGSDGGRGWGGRRADRMARMDTDGDGVISDAERAAARQERVTGMMTRLDADGDGSVTVAELGQSPRWMRIDPKTVDADGDGKVSAAELDKAIGDRPMGRGRWGRGRDDGSGAGSDGAPGGGSAD